MMRVLSGINFSRTNFTCINLAVLLSSVAFGQATTAKTADAPRAFDIADVHVSPRTDWVKNLAHALQGGFLSGDRYELRRATMLDLIKAAYNVDADKIYGGPGWLDYDRFEVVAKTKPGTRPDALRLMLQTLLADRFHLVVKMDTREVPGYVLSKGKGELKLKAAVDASGSGGCMSLRPTIDGDVIYGNLQCRGITMEAFAPALRRLVSAALANLPVVDSTGLAGAWDIDLRYGGRAALPDSRADAGIVEALDKLGLKLELGKVPQPVLVVESANEQPSANPPNVAASLPALPAPEFEVASIRLPCNDNFTMGPRFEAGGRVTATCMPLLSLITQVFNLAPFEQPVGIPKWLSSNSTASNISIVAKAPAGIAPEPQNNAQARDTLNLMLRALLIERYKMATHYEDRPMDAYTLTAGKPKLTKADPANRTACTRQNQQQQGRALQVRLVCQNMTMAQFAEQVQAYSTDIYYPVLDGTHLDGAWDFTVNYDAMANLAARLPLGGAAAGAPGEASDPSGSVSFVDAIEKQLGLKLEVHKRPVPVLVLDHIEEKPTEN